MTSNKTGIGKTTVSIGLADALNMLGKKTILALREPSMGPVFGIKGGATGGGKSCIEPSAGINLHFTGDFHAVAQANNFLSSVIDNHIFFGNELNIDTSNIFFKRCLDLNDRSLREITYQINGEKITTGFNITAASEIMAIMCLSNDFEDLRKNLDNILVALNKHGKPIFAKDLRAAEAMLMILKDAFKPNLVQTLEGTPALIHFGPFANIAHGCNSNVATKFALSNAEFCVTEAGFGSDLGAEKFIDIKSRAINYAPNVVVLVVVNEVIKEHGEGSLLTGLENVKKHIKNITDEFELPTVVAVNRHQNDSNDEIETIVEYCKNLGVKAIVVDAYSKGKDGCKDIANEVIKLANKKSRVKYVYEMTDCLSNKIEKIAIKIYGAKRVIFSDIAKEKISLAEKFGFGDFFVNIAKTQFSFSDNKELLGAPNNFDFTITDIEIRSGAKMIVAVAGHMLLMPGLGKKSNYLDMKVEKNGDFCGIT